MNKIEIKNIDSLLDGGSIKIETDKETFYVDRRIGTTSKNSVYVEYPKEDKSNIITGYDGRLLSKLVAALADELLKEKYNNKRV